MIFIKSFLLVGTISLIGQIILDNTKLTPGHVTSLFVVIGSILSYFNIYDILTNFSLVGSMIPITSFGNQLYKSTLSGFLDNGIVGMFSNMLKT